MTCNFIEDPYHDSRKKDSGGNKLALSSADSAESLCVSDDSSSAVPAAADILDAAVQADAFEKRWRVQAVPLPTMVDHING